MTDLAGKLVALILVGVVAGGMVPLFTAARSFRHFSAGAGHYYRSQNEQAVRELSDAIRLNPHFSKGYSFRARTYKEMRNYDAAIADFTHLIAQYPREVDYYIRRGSLHDDKRAYDRAVQDFTEALRLDSDNQEARIQRGWAYIHVKLTDLAYADFQRVIDNDPKSARGYRGRGRTYCDQMDHKKGIADYDQAIQLDPKSANAYHSRGWAYHEIGQYEKALPDFTRAIELEPKYANYYEARAWTYYEKKDYPAAIRDFDEAIIRNPTDADPYEGRGRCYLATGNLQQALKEYEEALKRAPNSSKCYRGRGNVYRKLGDNARANADHAHADQLSKEKDAASARMRAAAREAGRSLDEKIAESNRAAEQLARDAKDAVEKLKGSLGDQTGKAGPVNVAPGSDHARLQGKWKYMSDQIQGKVTSYESKDLWFKFAGNKVASKSLDGIVTFDFRMCPERNPPEFEVVFLDAVRRHIYKFEGDRLTIASGPINGPPPKTFTNGPGDRSMIIVLKRVPQ
jgi:uncharacterized protein (TIGR03067 family)